VGETDLNFCGMNYSASSGSMGYLDSNVNRMHRGKENLGFRKLYKVELLGVLWLGCRHLCRVGGGSSKEKIK